MKTAIAVSDYHVPHETMINRHFQLLFGGNVCILVGRYNGENPYNRPVFERRAPLCLADRLAAPAALIAHQLNYGTPRPPYGRRKAELRDWLRAQEVEMILAEFGTQAIAVAPLAHEMGIPIFSYFRGTDASKSLRRRNIINAYRKAVPKLTGVISVSQFLLDNLARHGIRNENAHVIPSGVNTSLFQPGDKRPKSCLAVGRMVEKKAPLTTIRAFAAAAKEHADARLTMLGGGPLLASARELVTRLGLTDRVALPGASDHETVRKALASHQIFLQHSVTAADGDAEGLPTAIQEAMASGCIVVSTRHAGIPEAVEDGITGYLVQEHDEASFAAALADVLAGNIIPNMAQAARDRATAHFDNNKLLAKLERTLRASL